MIFVYLLTAICATFACYNYLLVLQSTGYKPWRGYYWVVKTVWFWLHLCGGVLLYIFDIAWYFSVTFVTVTAVIQWTKKRKVRLAITKRIIRTMVLLFVANFAVCWLVDIGIAIAFLSLLVIVSWLILLPIESLIASYYISKARKKLSQVNLTIIAVTGSYGKTSVKDMVASLLSNSLAPAGSCNTPLGIAKFVNSTDLSTAKYLVLEFGARGKWDVKKLCKLYPPQVGVLTGICPQHLSTFGNLDNVIFAKQQLVLGINMHGFCVLNSASNAVEYGNIGSCKKIVSNSNLQIQLSNIDFCGSTFVVNHQGKTATVTLPQIALHTADTLAMAMQVCLQLGQSFEQTIDNLSKVKQTPHRMEISRCNDFYIVDDSYNASLVGVESCAKTLSFFRCPKVVITQGIVECGKDRKQQNLQCGKLLGGVVDVAVTLGKNSSYLQQGLLLGGCNKVLSAANLTDAVTIARKYAVGGLLVFQNDLPDSVNVM